MKISSSALIVFLLLSVALILVSCVSPLPPSPFDGFIPIEEFEGPEKDVLVETERWEVAERNVDYIRFPPDLEELAGNGEREAGKEAGGVAYVLEGKNVIEVYRPYDELAIVSVQESLETSRIIFHEAYHHFLGIDKSKEREHHEIIWREEAKFVCDYVALHPELLSDFNFFYYYYLDYYYRIH